MIDVEWTGKPGKGTGRWIAAFVLKGR